MLVSRLWCLETNLQTGKCSIKNLPKMLVDKNANPIVELRTDATTGKFCGESSKWRRHFTAVHSTHGPWFGLQVLTPTWLKTTIPLLQNCGAWWNRFDGQLGPKQRRWQKGTLASKIWKPRIKAKRTSTPQKIRSIPKMMLWTRQLLQDMAILVGGGDPY